MTNAQRLKILNQCGRTVFAAKDLPILWQNDPQTAKINAIRMLKNGLLVRLAKGYYALDFQFDTYELANSIISPSYISFNSALFYHNVCFQQSNIISSVARINYEKIVKKLKFKYYAMKESLFFNFEGISYKDNLAMAGPERAILDSFYFGLLPNIDQARRISMDYLEKIAVYYPKSVQQKIKKIRFYD